MQTRRVGHVRMPPVEGKLGLKVQKTLQLVDVDNVVPAEKVFTRA